MTDKAFQKIVLAKFDKLEKGQTELKTEVAEIKQGLKKLNKKVDDNHVEVMGAVETDKKYVDQAFKHISDIKAEKFLRPTLRKTRVPRR